MFKTISLLFVFLFLASCGKSGGSSAPAALGVNASHQSEETPQEEVTAEGALPTAALNFDVDVQLTNFNSGQESKVLEAADLIRKVITSEEFKERVLNHTVKGKKTFVDNDGLTNEQIYNRIITGSEELNPGEDNTMNLELEIYYESTDTVGYTFPNADKIWMNKKYLNKNKAWKVTTNMMHEWLHKLGFHHDKQRTAHREKSVPYAIGYLVAQLAKTM